MEWYTCARSHLHANTLRHIEQNKTCTEALGGMTGEASAARPDRRPLGLPRVRDTKSTVPEAP